MESKSEWSVTDAKNYCNQTINRYLFQLNTIQQEVFQAIKDETANNGFKFIDFQPSVGHYRIMEKLNDSFSRLSSYKHVLKVFNFWHGKLFKFVSKLKKVEERRSLAEVPKLLASIFLLNSDYYRALSCLRDAIVLEPFDSKGQPTFARTALLRIALFLEEWELFRIFYAEELQRGIDKYGEAYRSQIECLQLVYRLHTESDDKKSEITQKILHIWKVILGSNVKTFQYFECQSILKMALVVASRIPFIKIEEIGDPLYNRHCEFERHYSMLYNRFGRMFRDNESINLQTKAGIPEEFLKICVNIFSYLESLNTIALELFDCGMIREAEAQIYTGWCYSTRLGLPNRVLKFINSLLYTKTLMLSERGKIPLICAVLHSLLKPTIPVSGSTSKNSMNKTNSLISRLSTVFDTILGERPQEEMSIMVQPEIPKDVNVEKHSEKCSCAICDFALQNWNFKFETSWTRFLSSGFSSNEFHELATTWKHLRTENILSDRALLIESPDPKESFPSYVFQTYLRSLIISDFFAVKLTNGLSKISLIEEALELANYCSLSTRCQTLILNQCLRSKIYPLNASWCFLNEKTETVEQTSITDKLVRCFDKLSITSAKKPQSHSNIDQDDTTRTRRSRRKQDDLKRESSQGRVFFEDAHKQFQEFGHLLLRDWRLRICLYLATHTADRWSQAYYFSESQSCGIRQYTRFFQHLNPSDGYFHNSEEFKEAILRLPDDLTIIQLNIDENRVLWLTRFNVSHDPISIPLNIIDVNDQIISRMQQILIDSDNSVSRTKNLEKSSKNSTEFWTTRRKLNAELKDLLSDLQERWLDVFANLMIPFGSLINGEIDSFEKCSRKFQKAGYSRAFSTILVRLLSQMKESEWKSLASRLAILEGVSETSRESLVNEKAYAALKQKAQFLKSEDLYTLLVLPPELSFLPFECLPIFKEYPLVCRITSFHLFQRLLQRVDKVTDQSVEKYQLPKKVNARNSYYVLNPGGDLEQTQKRLEDTITNLKWTGLIGKPPSVLEFKEAIEKNDLFLYFGHGSGSKYFGRSAVRQSDCKAVSVLMGCASVKIVDDGPGFDGRSVIHEYTIARCPCIVGCLWMVTDGEIDRFFLELVKFCFTEIRRSPLKERQLDSITTYKKRPEPYKLLIRGIVSARKACKLDYLTGSAVVCYGLPIASMLT